MLKEIRKSFSYCKKKSKRMIMNESLIKQSQLSEKINQNDTIDHQSISTCIKTQKQTKMNENKPSTSPVIINTQKTQSIAQKKLKANTNKCKDMIEDNALNRDDKTIDTTQQCKLNRNSSHGTFSINKLNISSGSFAKQIRPESKVKRKLVEDYLLSLSHNLWIKDLQHQKEEFYQNYENNINMFEGWIQQIKSEGFEQNNKELLNKKSIVTSLEDNVTKMQKKVVFLKKGYGDKDLRLVKFMAKIQQEKELIEKNKAERVMINQEINELKKENLLFPSQTELAKEETRILNEQLITEKNKIGKCTLEIQQVNTKISNLNKEKETLLTSLKVLKKQNEAYRLKITNTYQKSSKFMLDVNSLVNETSLFYK